jgi:hypothetical protein
MRRMKCRPGPDGVLDGQCRAVQRAVALMAVFLLARAIRKKFKKRHPTP